MKHKLSIILIFIITSCSSNKVSTIDYTQLKAIEPKDYTDHLATISKDYLSYGETQVVKLSPESISYLEGVYERVVSNNQALLTSKDKAKFYFINHKSPFLFSLPKSQFFFSTSLIEKHLKSEELFVAALTAEILRSQRNIYEKKIVIPLGFFTTEKMIQLTRLKYEAKQSVNEWTYLILKRAGYDSSAYLNWIQVQSRNTLDFAMFINDPVSLSREEQVFKNFMSKQGVANVERKVNEANSSKEFYKLMKNIVSN